MVHAQYNYLMQMYMVHQCIILYNTDILLDRLWEERYIYSALLICVETLEWSHTW